MGGVFKAIGKMFGGGGKRSAPPVDIPDYEAERKKQEEEALKKRQQQNKAGLSSTILGGSVGDEGAVNQKKLLGQ